MLMDTGNSGAVFSSDVVFPGREMGLEVLAMVVVHSPRSVASAIVCRPHESSGLDVREESGIPETGQLVGETGFEPATT